jgi:hypothetical protein
VQTLTELTPWRVTLTTGAVVQVWADGYQILDEVYSFGVLVLADGEPETVLVTNRSPGNPSRFIIALAQFPVDLVAEIESV